MTFVIKIPPKPSNGFVYLTPSENTAIEFRDFGQEENDEGKK
jgi:hypothetical protein